MFCAAVKINNNWIAVTKGCFVPAAVLPFSIFPPAAGNCVPEEQGNIVTNVYRENSLSLPKSEALLVSKTYICRFKYV